MGVPPHRDALVLMGGQGPQVCQPGHLPLSPAIQGNNPGKVRSIQLQSVTGLRTTNWAIRSAPSASPLEIEASESSYRHSHVVFHAEMPLPPPSNGPFWGFRLSRYLRACNFKRVVLESKDPTK